MLASKPLSLRVGKKVNERLCILVVSKPARSLNGFSFFCGQPQTGVTGRFPELRYIGAMSGVTAP